MAASTDMDSLAGSAAETGNGVSGNDLVEGFGSLNLIRQVGLIVLFAASVAIGFALVLWSQGTDYRPLYAGLDRLDSREVIGILETNEINFKVDGNSGALLVKDSQLHKARLKLAEAGVPGESSSGFELLDKEQPLGTSQFMETARFRRSLEGELARTITSIHAVRSARVHLAIPKRTVFVRDAREPRASVFVELFPGRGIKPHQVRAISNLVASSIAELKLENVTVVDQKGNLLSTGEESKDLMMAAQQLEYASKMEKAYLKRIEGILDSVVGAGRYRAEVNADVDFNQVEQMEEIFNPDLPAIRSEQVLDEQRTGAGMAGIPGALTNQPPGQAEAPEQAVGPDGQPLPQEPKNIRNQSTRNYELDRTLSHTKHQLGKLRRLTIAVVVDDRMNIAADGSETRQPWSDNELERMAILVRNAVGFSAARGDSLDILNSPFIDDSEEEVVVEDIPFWQQPAVIAYLRPLSGLLIFLVFIFVFLLPVMRNLSATGRQAKEDETARELAALEAAGMDQFDALSDESVTLTGGDALALPSPEENYEQQINAVKALIAEDPGRVAQVIKRWVNNDE